MPDPQSHPIAADLLPDCVWQLDLELRVQYASPAALAMFGIPAEALAGSPLADHVEPADLERLREDLGQLLASDDRTRDLLFQVAVRHADGRRILVEVHARLLLDAGGEPHALVGLARDISERQRRRERQRARQRAHVEERQLATVARVAAATAAPLTEVLGAIDASGSPAIAGDRSVARARALLEELQLLAGRRELLRREVVVDALVSEIVGEIRVTMPPQFAVLHQPGAEHAVAWIDPTALREILRRLCAQARRAMSGGGAIRLATATRLDPGQSADHRRITPHDATSARTQVVIEVSDSGPGMDRETAERILEPFAEPAGDGPQQAGPAVARLLVHQHDGRLEVTSRLGRGTTFRVILPAMVAAEPADEPTSARSDRRLIVVDDDPDVRRYCKRVLGADGFEVVACEDGVEALAVMAGDEPFAAMLLDWALPGLDGRRVLEQARARIPRLPVLIISGHDRRPFASLGSVGPDTPWLVKPFTPAALQEAVGRLVPRSDAARES